MTNRNMTNSDGPGTLYEKMREFHWQRSQTDMQNAHDYGRAAGQALLLINGGAATAILAYLSALSKDSGSKLAGPVSPALFLFAFGVVFGAAMIWCAAQALAYYSLHHEYKALKDPRDEFKAQKDPREMSLRHRASRMPFTSKRGTGG
jgi:hypothetical protein